MAQSSVRCPYDVAFTTAGRAIMMACGKWSCPRCAKHNARMWAWRVKIHCKKHGTEWYFITLTLPGKIDSVAYGYKILPTLWDRLRKAIQALCGKWEYCAFVEGQPKRKGMPHFHIISNQKAPYRIKDFAASLGFGFQASQSVITGNKAASYCAKYASKTDDRMPKGFRRVRCSRGWEKLPEKEKRDKYLVRAKRERIEDYLIRVQETCNRELDDLAEEYYAAIRAMKEKRPSQVTHVVSDANE
jgi:hypothetical protein